MVMLMVVVVTMVVVLTMVVVIMMVVMVMMMRGGIVNIMNEMWKWPDDCDIVDNDLARRECGGERPEPGAQGSIGRGPLSNLVWIKADHQGRLVGVMMVIIVTFSSLRC